MLEGLVAWILNTYVGEYFEDLNTDQLSVALLQGEVELENLPLKKDAWNSLKYPIEMKSGHVGKIKFQIPVYRLHSEPWVISVEKLFIVFGPVSLISYTEEQQSQDIQTKLNLLKTNEAAWKATQSEKGESSYAYYTNWRSYSTSVFANIAENVQLNIKDVHIRYEDDSNCEEKQFACGIIIRCLTAESTDKNWVPTFNKSLNNDMSWKLIELKGLSCYWDTDATMLSALQMQDMMAGMEKHLDVNITSCGSTKEHKYILSQLDATARFRRNHSAQVLMSLQTPRISCDIHIENVSLSFARDQYKQMFEWGNGFYVLNLKWCNRKFRPSLPVSSCPKSWWIYAVTCNLEAIRNERHSRTWAFALQRAKDVKDYARVYYTYMKSSDFLSDEAKATKDALEVKLGLDEIFALQDVVRDKIKKENSVDQSICNPLPSQGYLQWLFPNWIGWYTSDSKEAQTGHDDDDGDKVKESILEEELLDVLNSAANDTFRKKDVLFAQINFSLLHGTFSLMQNEEVPLVSCVSNHAIGKQAVIELEFSDASARIETRPRLRSLCFEVKLGALYLYDRIFSTRSFTQVIAPQNRDVCITSSQSSDRMLFQSQQSSTDDVSNSIVDRYFFELLYEKNPRNVSADYRICVRTQPLDVVINLDLIHVLREYFCTNSTSIIYSGFSFSSAASAHYQHLKDYTKAELQHTWQQILSGERQSKSRCCIELEVAAPQIIMPQNVFDANTSVVIFDFGDLRVFNSAAKRIPRLSSESSFFDEDDVFHTPCSSPQEFAVQPIDEVELSSFQDEDMLFERMYESYVVELRNMQVLVSCLKDGWKFAQIRGSSSLHVLNRFSLIIEAHRQIIFTSDPKWPCLAVSACVPRLNAHVSERKVNSLRTCFDALNTFFFTHKCSEVIEKSEGTLGLQRAFASTFNLMTSDKLQRGFLIGQEVDEEAFECDNSRSFLLAVHFQVDQMFFDLQNESVSVAELQLSGLKMSYSKHLSETLLMLTLHSLLVVDASQTFGPEFDLLISSHKNISGKFSSNDQTGNSEMPSFHGFSSPAKKSFIFLSYHAWQHEELGHDALIYFTMKFSHPVKGLPEQCVATSKFNNLDVIANQDTIIELVRLVKEIANYGGKNQEDGTYSACEVLSPGIKASSNQVAVTNLPKTEITFDFHCLNILILRAVSQCCEEKKLATVVLYDVQIKTNIGGSLELQGTLGAVQLLDLVKKETLHQQILSIGNDIPFQNDVRPVLREFKECHNSSALHSSSSQQPALAFHIVKKNINNFNSSRNSMESNVAKDICDLYVHVRMASLSYVHSPSFFTEFSHCASEFKTYLKVLAESVRAAATQVAKGIIHTNLSDPLTKFERTEENFAEVIEDSCITSYHFDENTLLNIRCDILVKSPVIVLPLYSASPEVFVAHLGHFAIKSEAFSYNREGFLFISFPENHKSDIMHVEVSGMNLFYVNMSSERPSVEREKIEGDSGESAKITLFGAEHFGWAILDDTAIEVILQPFQKGLFSSAISKEADLKEIEFQKKLSLKANVLCPLKIALNKHHYQQLLKLFRSSTSGYSSDLPNVSNVLFLKEQQATKDVSVQYSAEHSLQSLCKGTIPTGLGLCSSHLVCAELNLPDFNIQLFLSEYAREKDNYINIVFKKFSMAYENENLYETSIKATLSSVSVESFHEHSGTVHCFLAMSSENKQEEKNFSTAGPLPKYPRMTSCSSVGYSKSFSHCPEPLVELNVLSVTELFSAELVPCRKTRFCIAIYFSHLYITFDLNFWVDMLNFFSSASALSDNDVYVCQQDDEIGKYESSGLSGVCDNIELQVGIISLKIVLKKPDYDLASATVSSFHSWMSKQENSFRLEGSLDNIIVTDFTAFGKVYRERLVTTSTEAIKFQIRGYKNIGEVNSLQNTHLIFVKAHVASVMYVHTQRFITEILEFLTYFQGKQDVMSKSFTNYDSNENRYTFLFDIIAESPVLVLPSGSFARDVLILSLENIKLDNKVLFAVVPLDQMFCSDGTSSCNAGCSISFTETFVGECHYTNGIHKDTMGFVLQDFNVFSGEHSFQHNDLKRKKMLQVISPSGYKLLFTSYVIQRKQSLLREKCTMEVQVERNICAAVPQAPDIVVSGVLSSVHVLLDIEEYKLCRSILSRNLGETLEECIYDPCKEDGQFVLMDVNTEVILVMSVQLKLVNVTVEIYPECKSADNHTKQPLAKFDFLMSDISYASFSDNSKDLGLVSNEIRITDVRYNDCPANKRPNVFATVFQPNRDDATDSALQAEVHYRVTHDFSKLTILFNNLRIMGVLDFLMNTYNFITCSLPSEDESAALNLTSLLVLPSETKQCFEVKINASNSELVLLEDASELGSNAIIIQSTATICWRPDHQERPLSCSFQQFQMFSCILGVEDATKLTIIEPLYIGLDVVNKQCSSVAKLQFEDILYSLEVCVTDLNLHISYCDFVVFMKILDSVKQQFQSKGTESSMFSISSKDDVSTLCCLGFAKEDCQKALIVSKDNLNDAALWLTQNATVIEDRFSEDSHLLEKETEGNGQWSKMKLHLFEFRIDSLSALIIEEYKDGALPVLEISGSDCSLFGKILGSHEGHIKVTLSIAYYNCALSGWEPLVEPWRCNVTWNSSSQLCGLHRRLFFQISADDILNFNVTAASLKLYKTVKEHWNMNYFHYRNGNICSAGDYRRRSQLIPFALKNNTGCKLWFSTQVTTSDSLVCIQEQYREINRSDSSSTLHWQEVKPGGTTEISFGNNVNVRHKRDSHQMVRHQIIVKLEGWQVFAPVSVDRVGIFVRHAHPVRGQSMPIGRLVFQIKLGNEAQKCITVQSALLVSNRLEDILQINLQSQAPLFKVKEHHLYLPPGQTVPIPMPFINAKILVRPANKFVTFSDYSVSWEHVTVEEKFEGRTYICISPNMSTSSYRFSSYVMNESYPDIYEFDEQKESSNNTALQIPGHKIFFLPCFELVNLLPYELNYSIDAFAVNGCIKPGGKQPLCNIDVSTNFSFKVSVEHFRQHDNITVSLSTRHYPSQLILRDTLGRLLNLQLKFVPVASNALKVFISAPYWLVNRTGLPLVFKQEGAQTEAAGQFSEHEIARSISPLMFSFADEDASLMCSMRIGKSLHSEGFPTWCARFRSEKGVRFRRLHVSRRNSRPDWVYNIGIEVTSGRGMYKDTSIVILTPRYQLDNRSKYSLEFCQKFAVMENRQFILSAMPECSLPFHWPRIDLDNLLCVRMADVPSCFWSGGFTIDKTQSFHINMRDADGTSHFLQIEVVLHGATFYVIFTGAEFFPPPIRIDNYSEVSITYYQTNITEERLKTTVRPHSSVPYAWDEPMLPPYITCCAPGGSLATYNTEIFREGSQLFYENFIYIAFTGTYLKGQFKDSLKMNTSCEILQNIFYEELVLDVPYGTKVILNKKETGKRSQLWRMTSSGMLQHEGSSPPTDLHKIPSSSSSSPGYNTQQLVLDIATLCPQPEESAPLMLRKPDVRRHHTQTWKFTSDGRLCCGYPNLCVQPSGGYSNLKPGNFAVLGPLKKCSSVCTKDGVPVEQAICRQKLRGGSGVLCVSMVPDGPTRVLRISDLKQKANISHMLVYDAPNDKKSSQKTSTADQNFSDKSKASIELQMFLKLKQGLGLSIINHLNEDLVYLMMKDITVELNRTSSGLLLDGSFKTVQVDNQLRESKVPVVLFATPTKLENQNHLPDVHLTVSRSSTTLCNADIFKHFIVNVKNLCVYLEEYLLIKLLQFLQFYQTVGGHENLKENNSNFQSSLYQHPASGHRYYFSTLKLSLQQVRLSVHTSDNLPADLQQIKKKAGLHLIGFEDAPVELDTFLRVHPFETAHFLTESIIHHYKEELKSQAARILGAVDFLGNPLGLVNDVTDGISELIHEGNFGGLIKNVAHGLSDSAAKLSETLSDGLGLVAIDDKHQRIRKQIRQGSSNRHSVGNDHLIAGLQGLGIGLLGGMTSLFTQTYEGVAHEGIQGLISGFGKGLVGTVAKPAVGFLDLASGAASAVRDTSKKNVRALKSRLRPPRLYVGPRCLLPQYSLQQALDQELLYKLNNKDYSELFIAKETIQIEPEEIQVLVSCSQVYFLNSSSPSSSHIIPNVALRDLIRCSHTCFTNGTLGERRHYLQLHIKDDAFSKVRTSPSQSFKNIILEDEKFCKKPQFRCYSSEVAEKVVIQINYAKYLYDESKYMVSLESDPETSFGDS